MAKPCTAGRAEFAGKEREEGGKQSEREGYREGGRGKRCENRIPLRLFLDLMKKQMEREAPRVIIIFRCRRRHRRVGSPSSFISDWPFPLSPVVGLNRICLGRKKKMPTTANVAQNIHSNILSEPRFGQSLFVFPAFIWPNDA